MPGVQDQLAAQQKILEEHLKMALSPQMLLHTSVDTSTIAEKIVFTLDGLLEVYRASRLVICMAQLHSVSWKKLCR